MPADIAAAVFNKLTTDTDVSALIKKRAYPSYDRSTDRVYPLAVYQLDISPVTAYDGPTTMTTATLEIAAVAKTYAQAVTVGQAIYAALQYPGHPVTWGSVTVQGCFLQDDGQRDDVITEPTTEEILYYVKSFRFDLSFDN